MPRTDLLSYWPAHDAVADCIKSEAEASSEAVSLAVHQPMRFERRIVGESLVATGDSCGERDLLREFLAEDLPEGRVIVPIVGSSGIGKSHVVRWLDAELRRSPGADRRVVVRIPKGMSLRGVLRLLLDRLADSRYEQYRQELSRAVHELDPDEAAGSLCERLAQVLETMGVQAKQRLIDNPHDQSAQAYATYCSKETLPTLFRTQILRDTHFLRTPDGGKGVVARLVEQLTENVQAGQNDDRQHLFVIDDLRFDTRIDFKLIGKAAADAIQRIDRNERRPLVVSILNEALDDAKQHLLNLDPTVSDLFDAVRRELLAENKELVLLVEDFAVLSGLQKQLLQIIIKEAVRDGQQVLCTMRTALAYTTGYPMPETVLTRAKVEYRIPDEPGSEEQILDRVERLVGAYLNAARLGQAKLERAYSADISNSDDVQGWIPRFAQNVEPEERATLDVFGSSCDGYELFPFNPTAIHQFAREGCLQGGKLVYNPRLIIVNVITRVLKLRELFERGSFPPNEFGRHAVSAAIVQEVARRIPESDRNRYLRLLAYWGGNLRSASDLGRLPTRLFSAFGLDPIQIASGEPSAQSPQPARREDPRQRPPREPTVDPLESKWEDVLEQWRRGKQLLQADANQLRRWIVEALKTSIDWDWQLFRPRKEGGVDTWHQFVFVPNAPGNEGRTAETAMVALCTEEHLRNEVESARIQAALMAVVRIHGVYKGDWDYDGAVDDLPRYAALVESLVPRARDFVRSRYLRTEWDPIGVLVQGLSIGARALGLEGADKDQDVALLNALFLPAPDGAMIAQQTAIADSDPTGWTRFTRALAMCRPGANVGTAADQVAWPELLLELVGARQGGADKVHAIDLSRIKPILAEVMQTWQLTAQFPRAEPAGVREFGPFKRSHAEIVRSATAVAEEQKWLCEWSVRTKAWIGDGEKAAVVSKLKETVERARAAGVGRDVDTRALLELIERFRLNPVNEALAEVGALGGTVSRGKVLAVLGHGYAHVARLCDELCLLFTAFEKAVVADLKGEATRLGHDPVAEAVTELRLELEEINQLLVRVKP